MDEWRELRKTFNFTPEEEKIIECEKELIRTMVRIREEQGLSQAELARMSNVKQPVIARMEKAVHSPQIDSLLRILTPMGYTLSIVPIGKDPDAKEILEQAEAGAALMTTVNNTEDNKDYDREIMK